MSDDVDTQIVGLLTEIRDLLKEQHSLSNSNGSSEAPANRYKNEQGKWVWQLPPDPKPSKCRYCEGEIFWVKSKKGKNVPCDKDGICHYETCPEKKDTNNTPFVPTPQGIDKEDIPF